MKNDRWEKAKKIFAEATKFAPGERERFLADVCRGDADTRREVESLLASFDEAGDFMENPPVGEVADVIGQDKSLKRGICFGHCEIVEQIGAGGMGEVYLARDKKLDRLVAVKILKEKFAKDESNLQRFTREAKAASALNHPNILVIHEIGETEDAHFIVSEFIKGETLREVFKNKTLKFSEILDVSIQIASALCAAHEARLIHRDIKPENIMIRPDGYVKILDFGLAKLVEQKAIGFENETANQNETARGVILGTINYMSPEQAKGERVDERADIFSFGAVIYEMLAGRTPFAGDSPAETLASLIDSEPQPISRFAEGVPDELSRIVSVTLKKDKGERYQTMNGVLADLRSLRENFSFDECREKSHATGGENATEILQATTGDVNVRTAETNYSFARQFKRHASLSALALIVLLAAIGLSFWHFNNASANTSQIESIAVLPFENQNPDTEYLSDGLTESVINSLSGLPNLRVISRNSVFQYKGKAKDLLSIGREMDARAVLTGRFIQRGDDLMVSAELTDVRDNKQIWGRQYNRKATDAFALQQEISRDISETLRAKLSGEERQRIAKRETDSPEAFQLYLKGRYYWNKRTAENFEKAVKFFKQAIDKDPTYALAYVGLANCYLLAGFPYDITLKERVAMIKDAADKALEIDPTLGEVHATLAINYLFNEWDWANAEREYKIAIELSPNYATAHHWYAEFLATEGRFDESFAEYQRALELDPLSLAISTDLGMSYYYARQLDRAIEHLEKLKKIDPNYMRTYIFLAKVYVKKEMFVEAITEDTKGYALAGADPQTLAARKTILENAVRTSGAKGYWQKMLELESDPLTTRSNPVTIAVIHSELNERDKAFELLEKGYNARMGILVSLKVSPEFDSLRSDPRYADLMRRVGLPQ